MKHWLASLILFALLIGCSSRPVQPPASSTIIYHTDWVKIVEEERKMDVEELWQILPEGSDATRILATGWFGEYSPDNSLIAYGGPYDNGIWVMNADGTNPVQLTSFGSGPSWSPDGSQLVFHEGGVKGADHYLWIVNVDGTDVHQLSSVNGSFAHWSPDGNEIIFHGEVNNGIWLIKPDGSNETMFYQTGGYPAWSPDGEKIAYVDLKDWRIWVMDADGQNKMKLTDHGGIHPAWSADGSQITYEGMGKGKSGIWVINSDGTQDHRISVEGRHPDWSN